MVINEKVMMNQGIAELMLTLILEKCIFRVILLTNRLLLVVIDPLIGNKEDSHDDRDFIP